VSGSTRVGKLHVLGDGCAGCDAELVVVRHAHGISEERLPGLSGRHAVGP